MTNAKFKELTRRRLEEVARRLESKGKEYVRGEDRLQNLKDEAWFNKTTLLRACLSKLSKHVLSIADMCRDEKKHAPAAWKEKVGDAIAYLVLLEACALEDGR